MLDGFLISACARTQSVIAQSPRKAESIAATAATTEAKKIQAPFLACGQHVHTQIHWLSDSIGAIGVANRRGLQRLRHLDVSCRLSLPPNVLFRKVARLGERGSRNTKLADKRSLEFCRSHVRVLPTPKQFLDTVV